MKTKKQNRARSEHQTRGSLGGLRRDQPVWWAGMSTEADLMRSDSNKARRIRSSRAMGQNQRTQLSHRMLTASWSARLPYTWGKNGRDIVFVARLHSMHS
ncbi:hypothetical protein AAFF_G00309920 [Aldrovandia affinis]|uniref:Uncharacterized protein n=1 Tax=Aldrovandia affinis TaxID=143900 RepID=A0AAD7SNU4_9TELE|nr:hypothetical protein AAFF_G00309920 [Aldrovandia affinis]